MLVSASRRVFGGLSVGLSAEQVDLLTKSQRFASPKAQPPAAPPLACRQREICRAAASNGPCALARSSSAVIRTLGAATLSPAFGELIVSLPGLAERHRQVDELKAVWGRVSRQHVAAGAGCGCSFGGLILQAADFELDIVAFLLHDASKAKAARVTEFVTRAALRGPGRYSLRNLLDALAATSDTACCQPADLDFIIAGWARPWPRLRARIARTASPAVESNEPRVDFQVQNGQVQNGQVQNRAGPESGLRPVFVRYRRHQASDPTT